MRDYLFVYPIFRPIGGAEATAAWMLQALVERGSVTVVTAGPADLAALDRWCGTKLSNSPPTVIQARWWLSERLERWGQPHDLWQFRYFVREARRQRQNHSMCISAFNDLDLGPGPPVFQYLHVAPCNDSKSIAAKTYTLSNSKLMKTLLRVYTTLCDFFVPWKQERIANNWTVANSQWSSAQFANVYGRPADAVLFPPPLGKDGTCGGHDWPWFLSLARAEPQKGWQDAIDIVLGLRQKGHATGLSMYVIPGQDGYLEYLQAQVAEHPDCLTLTVHASREEIERAIASHRYGLHASELESYGMAVAELLLGGCLTAVREQGGQTEIVTEPELRFQDVAEAIEKLDRVLTDPTLSQRLLASQQSRRELFTRDVFLRGFHRCLDDFEARLGRSATSHIP